MTIGGVTKWFRCRPVPRSMGIGQPHGDAMRTSYLPWRWSVETRIDVGKMHRLVLSGDMARDDQPRVHAGIAQLTGDRPLLRAHASAFVQNDLSMVTLPGVMRARVPGLRPHPSLCDRSTASRL